MSYRLGIDLGTTYTAAAVLRDGADPEAVRLGERGLAAPSVVFVAENGAVLFGDAAEDRAPDAPERIARHFKRRIGDEVPLVLGGNSEDHVEAYAHDLYAAMIAWVVATVAAREGARPDAIAVTHPASWNRRKLDLLLAALEAQHLPPVTLITEPEAAAVGYARTGLIPHPATLAVYDLGGGTLDVALLETTAEGHFTRRGNPTGLDGLGGIDFDDAILGHVLAAVDAATWAGIDADQMDPTILRALAALRTASVAAKETLSTETETSVSVSIDGTLITVPLKRADFDGLIDGMVDRSVEFFHEVLANADLDLDDLTAVLLTGGSVQVPLVTDMLSDDLPVDVRILRAVDPKAMVAAGAVLSLPAALAAVPAARSADPRRGADLAVAQARAFFESAGFESAGAPIASLPGARDGAAADRPVSVAAITAPIAAPRPMPVPVGAAPAPAPGRAGLPPVRLTEMPARPSGHSFFDDPAEDDIFVPTTAKGRRRAKVLTRVGVFVLLAAGVAVGTAYMHDSQSPTTESANTQVTRGAELIKAEAKNAYKPKDKKAEAKSAYKPKDKKAAATKADRAAARISPRR